MPDEIDRVQEACDRRQEELLAEHFKQQRLNSSVNKTPGICIDCERPIPAGRLAVQLNAERCVQCQTDFEAGRPE